jgi:hypothetical protein
MRSLVRENIQKHHFPSTIIILHEEMASTSELSSSLCCNSRWYQKPYHKGTGLDHVRRLNVRLFSRNFRPMSSTNNDYSPTCASSPTMPASHSSRTLHKHKNEPTGTDRDTSGDRACCSQRLASYVKLDGVSPGRSLEAQRISLNHLAMVCVTGESGLRRSSSARFVTLASRT